MLKIAIASDTHRYHRSINVPDADLFIHCGDIGIERDWMVLSDFNDWLGELPHKHKIVIPGNHDLLIEQDPEMARIIIDNAHFLIDQTIDIEGYKIYGSPWQPEFCNWAWNLPRGDALKRVWSKIPDDTDILITHGPPAGILDRVPRENAGCQDLLDRIEIVKPKLHCFGHIHEGYGVEKRNDTLFVNAAIAWSENKPIVVNI